MLVKSEYVADGQEGGGDSNHICLCNHWGWRAGNKDKGGDQLLALPEFSA